MPDASTNDPLAVELPGGGQLELQSAEEVSLWQTSAEKYQSDYNLRKTNDLVLLGALLSNQLVMYRNQKLLTDAKSTKAALAQIKECAGEIREIEKALGIDKKTREQGGTHTIHDYLETLKAKAHAKGIHIVRRTKAYEAFVAELRVKLRVLRNGDQEDRHYHGISERQIIEWCETECKAFEDKDKEWADEKGKVFVGKA